jgi:hypothetical protein
LGTGADDTRVDSAARTGDSIGSGDSPSSHLRLIQGLRHQTTDAVETADTDIAEIPVEDVVVPYNDADVSEDIVVEHQPGPDDRVREDRIRPARVTTRKPRSGSFSFRKRWGDPGRTVWVDEDRAAEVSELARGMTRRARLLSRTTGCSRSTVACS